MFSTRIRADSILPASRSWAMARRCCFDTASSFCWTIRRRAMESLSCTLSLAWRWLASCFELARKLLTMRDDEGAILMEFIVRLLLSQKYYEVVLSSRWENAGCLDHEGCGYHPYSFP